MVCTIKNIGCCVLSTSARPRCPSVTKLIPVHTIPHRRYHPQLWFFLDVWSHIIDMPVVIATRRHAIVSGMISFHWIPIQPSPTMHPNSGRISRAAALHASRPAFSERIARSIRSIRHRDTNGNVLSCGNACSATCAPAAAIIPPITICAQ